MRLRFTAFLLVANLAVFGLIWRRANDRNREQPPAELVFPVNAERISLSGPEAPGAYELRLVAGRWQLASPYEWPANPWSVQKLLDELRFISREGGFTLEEAGKLGNTAAAYGLDHPRMTLTVGAGPESVTVGIGAMTPGGNAAYLLTPDGKTVLPAPKSLLAALARKPEELRRAEVLSIDPFEVSGVTLALIEGGKETRIGLKRGEAAGAADASSWRFETPVATDADTPVVDKHLAALGELRFRRFLPSTPELLDRAGLAAPSLSLTIEGNNRRQTLLVGALDPEEKSPHRYAKFKDNAVVFTLADEALKPWIAARREMREHRFMRFDPATLTGITVNEGARTLVLQRLESTKGGKVEWHMPLLPGSTATVALPVDNDQLAALAASLSGLTARDFHAPAGATPAEAALAEAFVTDEPTPAQLTAWGFATPARKVDLAFADGAVRLRSLLIAAPIAPGGPYHAKLSDAPSVYSIAPAVLTALSVKPHAYRRRTLEALTPAARVAAMTVTDLATGKVILKETKPDDVPAWETWLEARPKTERTQLLALADRCRSLRAERFLGHPFDDAYKYDAGDGSDPAPWRYRFEFTVKATDGAKPETHTLLLTRRLAGTEQLAGSREHNALFFLNQDWVDALYPLTFGRDNTPDLPPLPVPAGAAAPTPAK